MAEYIWNQILRGDKILKHEFDVRYSNVVEDLKQERGANTDLLAGWGAHLVPNDEREKIATMLWNELLLERTSPSKDVTYDEIILGQEVYRKLIED